MTRYTVTVCPGCGRRLGVNGVDIHRMPPASRPSANDLALLGKARRDASLTPETLEPVSRGLAPASAVRRQPVARALRAGG